MIKFKAGITVFAVIEILIGCVTLMAVTVSLIRGWSQKPSEVIIFVLATASISAMLGIGILRRSWTSYYLLLYFSSIIILSKFLIFAKIITLNGALETTIPNDLKSMISIAYHGLVILYFSRAPVRKEFID